MEEKEINDIEENINDLNEGKGGFYIVEAVVEGYGYEKIKELLKKGDSPNYQSIAYSKGAALHWAANALNTEILKLLIEYKADYSLKNKNRDTPLHECFDRVYYGEETEKRRELCVKILLEHKADLNVQNNEGKSPFTLAVRCALAVENERRLYIVNDLLNADADINIQDKNGQSPLHEAAESCNKDVVILLLNKKACIDMLDNDGNTALHAVAGGYYKQIKEDINDRIKIMNILICKSVSSEQMLALFVIFKRFEKELSFKKIPKPIIELIIKFMQLGFIDIKNKHEKKAFGIFEKKTGKNLMWW